MNRIASFRHVNVADRLSLFRQLCRIKILQPTRSTCLQSLQNPTLFAINSTKSFHSTVAKPSEEDFEDGDTPSMDWVMEGENGEPPASPRARHIAEEILKLSMSEILELQRLYRIRAGITEEEIQAIFGVGSVPSGPVEPEVSQNEVKEEKTKFDLKITGFDAKSKIKVIKEVRTITGLGLKEAKELVENVPKKLKEGIKKEEADELLEKLKAAGAEVEIE